MKKTIKLTESDISRLINEVFESFLGNDQIITIGMNNSIEDLVFEFCEKHGMNEGIARSLIEEVKESVTNILSNALHNMNFINGR